MKNIILSLITVLIISSSVSCNKWLDIQPKTEIKSELMFSSVSGFKDALMGVYVLMCDRGIYGGEMTYGFVEALSQQYMNNNMGFTYYSAKNYDYSKTATYYNAIWAKSYNVIANINNILDFLEQKKSMLGVETYSVMKGELLGLRAYIHFDLLRLYSWGNLSARPQIMNRLSIPYSTRYEKIPARQSSVRDVLDFIKGDLVQSIDLLDKYGPWGTAARGDSYYLPNDDKFFESDQRKYRFNFWAAYSTMARVLMWEGDKKNALTYATKVTDTNKFSWVSSTSIDADKPTQVDYLFSTELVFTLKIEDLFSRIKPNIDVEAGSPNANDNLFSQKQNYVNTLFDGQASGATDYRFRKWYNKSNPYSKDDYGIDKFWEVEDASYGKAVPLIRKSELFYIAAECYLEAGDIAKAVKALNEVRKYRGIAPAFDLSPNMEKAAVMNEITKEYQREFLCEGQLFFFYKRLGMEVIPNYVPVMDDTKYVVPIPIGDVGIGGLEDNKK